MKLSLYILSYIFLIKLASENKNLFSYLKRVPSQMININDSYIKENIYLFLQGNMEFLSN